MNDLEIRKYIKDRKIELAMNQEEFAALLGVSKATLAFVESGIRPASKEFLKLLKQENPKLDVNIFF